MRTMSSQLGQRLDVLGARLPVPPEIPSTAIVMMSRVKAGTLLEEVLCPLMVSQLYSVKILAALWTVLVSTILLNAPFWPAPITNSQLDPGKRSKVKIPLSQTWYVHFFLIMA
jgi:hypothetical protein